MSYKFDIMTQEQAEDIAYKWHYNGVYAFYDMEADKEDLTEFLDQEERADSYYIVSKDNEMIGFFCFQLDECNSVDIGLGMKPELTGKGLGNEFLQAGLDYAGKTYTPDKLTLSVATFNKRAIKVYEKVGFYPVKTFMQSTNGSHFEFVKMEKNL
ncbi:GNAT family N-acetyltransferase [Bacillus solimangrovi]|uniref:GNAT family N-acetyltransferase n=1 Tax=Bacillus solimangrovi TaxID=1305675 RepID=A0A1E5LE27_9BACI|nr:GNAT family protein [Bacillus solimangrovi]OEH92338.1 GNAT family N-acetyltransferase [Bacillus solimangrovi]